MERERRAEEREQRRAEGLRRIIVGDVRVIAMRLQPWLVEFATLRLDDLVTSWQRLADDIRDKDLVTALTKEQDAALFDLYDRFGRDTAFEQVLWEQHRDSPTETLQDAANREFRKRTVANFASTIRPLIRAGKALGDETTVELGERLRGLLRIGAPANPYLNLIDFDDEPEGA